MLITSPIGAQAAGYYFHGQPPGIWLGKGAAALHLAGVAEVRPLTAVLRGCHPRTGAFLPTVKPARRRSGWDLILAAPKSVSLLASRPQVVQAHRGAVMGAMAHFESVLARGSGVVAAGFGHVQNAAGEPHLHTHLVVANLAHGADGAWAHLSSCGWWPHRHELSAVYQLGLRHQLREAGLDLDWRMRDDGLADVAGVPRAAIRAASSRSRTAAAEAADRRVAGARLRGGIQRGATALTRRATDRPPPAPAEAAAIPAAFPASPGRPLPAVGELEAAVTGRLLLSRSTFRRTDVFDALAACCPAGMTSRDAEQWVDDFCDRALGVEGQPGRWTTARARAADERLEAALTGARILAAPPGRSNLLAHAAYLESAAPAGATVRLVTGSPQGALRWQVLTGIGATAGGRADLVLVDHADRRSTPELLAVVGGAVRHGTAVVLVEGGTRARLTWVCSDGLVRAGSYTALRVDPGPEPAWAVGSAGPAGRLLAAFAATPDSAVLVGLGPPEVDGLNQAARRHLLEQGRIAGPAAVPGGRVLQAGDRVVALRRLGGGIAPGTLLAVTEVDPRTGRVGVTSPLGRGRPEPLDRATAAHLGYGYALTPALAARVDAPLLVLGPPEALGRHRDRVRAAEMARDPRGLRREGPSCGAFFYT